MAHTLFLLGELSDQDVDWMVETGQREKVDAGTVLIHEGEPVTTLYVLLDGLLEISGRSSHSTGDHPLSALEQLERGDTAVDHTTSIRSVSFFAIPSSPHDRFPLVSFYGGQ